MTSNNIGDFRYDINPIEIEEYEWSEKEKKKRSWINFFHQYGMNKITKN